MGFLYKSKCYAVKADADNAFFSDQQIDAFNAATMYVTRFVNSGGSWFLVKSTYNSAGTLTAQQSIPAPVMTYPACDELAPDYFLDGVNQADAIFTAILLFALILGFGQGFKF